MHADCGIKDFRSSRGIYNERDVKKMWELNSNPTMKSKQLQFFSDFMNTVDKSEPGINDYLVVFLNAIGKLQRFYTMNVDNLESKSGLQTCDPLDGPAKTVRLHGNIDLLECERCGHTRQCTKVDRERLGNGLQSPCENDGGRGPGKREVKCPGGYFPQVQLYHSVTPNSSARGEAIGVIQRNDLHSNPDLLIVLV